MYVAANLINENERGTMLNPLVLSMRIYVEHNIYHTDLQIYGLLSAIVLVFNKNMSLYYNKR